MNPPDASGFSFEALRREPDVDAPDLVAVDATDRLLLDEAADLIADAAPGAVVVLDDRYGALTLGAVALHGARDVRTYQDAVTGERALARNAERTGLTGTFTSHDVLDAGVLSGARVVLLQLPRSLDALDDLAVAVATLAEPDVVLLAGGRVKHMTTTMNEVLGRHFMDVQARLARQKSRVLVATGARRPEDATPRTPAQEDHLDLDLTVRARGGVFAGTRVDIGTRALLQHLDSMAPDATSALDLGCGSGVLATALARARPGLQVTATDVSAAAVASARATAEANGVGDRVDVRRDHGASGLADGSVDLVVLNPPFHQGGTVHAGVAHHLFAEAARVLRPGGELWAVWNSHLQYRPLLERTVGTTRQATRDRKFTVTVSTRRA